MSRLVHVAWVVIMFVSVAYAQSADPPTYSVGDEWKFTNGRVQKVVKVDGDAVAMTGPGIGNCPGCLWYFDKSLNLQSIAQADGTPATTSKGFLPISGWQYWRFPLDVKKEWRLTPTGLTAAGRTQNYTIDCTVQAYEDVVTKAGTFKAFRVLRQWSTPAEMQSGRAGSWVETVWYAPEVKTVVKYSSTNPRAGDPWELSSYSLK